MNDRWRKYLNSCLNSLLISIISDKFNHLSYIPTQVKKIEDLRVKIRLEKEKVEREMERQQVSMADKRMVELARLASQPVRNGEGMAG